LALVYLIVYHVGVICLNFAVHLLHRKTTAALEHQYIVENVLS